FGEDHIELARTLRCKGMALLATDASCEARAVLEKALDIFQRHLGKEHLQVAKTLRHLALANPPGSLERARAAQRAISILEREVGADHPWTREVEALRESRIKRARQSSEDLAP
ncbi:unnamed protein product, partial [Effrenium voratum]